MKKSDKKFLIESYIFEDIKSSAKYPHLIRRKDVKTYYSEIPSILRYRNYKNLDKISKKKFQLEQYVDGMNYEFDYIHNKRKSFFSLNYNLLEKSQLNLDCLINSDLITGLSQKIIFKDIDLETISLKKGFEIGVFSKRLKKALGLKLDTNEKGIIGENIKKYGKPYYN